MYHCCHTISIFMTILDFWQYFFVRNNKTQYLVHSTEIYKFKSFLTLEKENKLKLIVNIFCWRWVWKLLVLTVLFIIAWCKIEHLLQLSFSKSPSLKYHWLIKKRVIVCIDKILSTIPFLLLDAFIKGSYLSTLGPTYSPHWWQKAIGKSLILISVSWCNECNGSLYSLWLTVYVKK